MLTVSKAVSRPAGSACTSQHWLCLCECGTEVIRTTGSLNKKAGSVRSCGCYRIKISTENVRKRCTTHGLATRNNRSRTYQCWANMKQRCRPESEDAAFYFDRGVSICERWHTFSNFLEDMGECPAGLTLDRIDGTGNYEPGNCRWADWDTQHNNTRRNRYLTIQGRTLTMAHAAKEYGVNYSSLRSRVYILGLDPSTAIFGDGGNVKPLSAARKGGQQTGGFAAIPNRWRKEKGKENSL